MSDTDNIYASPFGFPVQDPPRQAPSLSGAPRWLMGTLAQQFHYDPQGTMWPDPNAKPAPAPAPPDPLVPFSGWQMTPPKRTAGSVVADTLGIKTPADLAMLAAPLPVQGLAAAAAPQEAQAARLPKTMGRILGNAAEAPTVTKTLGEIAGVAKPDVSAAAPYIMNPSRVANPGVYKRPDVIAAEAAANVAPEHPALRELFGVTRDDLYGISQQGRRQGNVEPQIWTPSRAGKINEASAAVMTPANAQRLVDTMSEAQKYPELIKGMDPWYVMDPAYQRMVQLVGPERAREEYIKFNMSMTPFSAGSNVLTEINRGTAANMMRARGEYPLFRQYAGLAEDKRGADFPDILRDVKGHMMHANQADPVTRYIATGEHGYDPNTVKIPLYTQASGVPETGFQTRLPVPDAHFTRALGMPDVRKMANFNEYMGGTEYRPIGPWYRENVAKPLGIEAVPAQARMWGLYAPQTGVKTPVGAGKLELLSQRIWDRAQQLGVDPKQLRDDVLTGKAHASWLLGGLLGAGAMGDLARQDEYEP